MFRSTFRHRVTCAMAALTISAGSAVGAATMEGFSVERLFPGASFDRAVPTQEQVLGVAIGARPLRHAELLRYLEALAAATPRVKVVEYARTHEGRPMVYVAVGDPAVIAGLERFREDHAARLDPRGRPASADAAALDGSRAVAFLAYGIHGDELSSVDAAAAVIYRLAAGEDATARHLREELLVLVDPAENPDGRDRYLAQTAAFAHASPNRDQEDLSHTAVWPWGRGNHYLFDLNRDWFSQVQPESERSSVMASWDPQLVVDSHEMGSNDTYLFPPPRHPFNPFLPPKERAWWDRFAADQARALDARGYPYFTREWNEEFFPGYGSSWASYQGAVGILYEMSGTEGTLVRKHEGTIRTYPQAVEHHVVSSLANLQTLADHRTEVLADFVAARREAIAGDGRVAAWILPEGRHPERTRHLVDLLSRQGIEVWRSSGRTSLEGLRDARTAAPVDAGSLPATVWMVPVDQPAGRRVRVLLDPHVPMDAPFFREEREHLERGKGTRLYEITAWSLPLCFDVEAYWTARRPQSGFERAEPAERQGRLVDTSAPVAWLTEGEPDPVVPALADLLQAGIAVKVAEKPFRVGGHDYGRGALLVPAEGNPDDVATTLRAIAERRGIEIRAVGTAKAESGPDLGGSHFHPLIEPRVGIWTGAPIAPSSYGALWHLMDLEVGLRFSGLDLTRPGAVDLERYNVLVFPPARGGRSAYASAFGDAGRAALERWIDAGGTAIGIGGGAEFLADVKSDLTRTRLRRQALESYPPVVLGLTALEAQQAGPFRAVGLRAPDEPDDAGKQPAGKGEPARKPAPPKIERASPYDVAPLLGPAARFFAEGHEQGTPVALRPLDLAEWLAPYLPPGKAKPERADLERADERLRRFAPNGAFLRLELDPEMWLSWGLPEQLPALIDQSDTLVAEPPVQVAARFVDPERLQIGGLLWPEAAGRLAGTAYVTREAHGEGQVILFLSEPEFRGWTLGTRRLLLNAVLYGPGLGTRWPTPW